MGQNNFGNKIPHFFFQAHLNKKHKKERSDETKYKCEHCFKEFATMRKVKEHSKHFHGLSLKCEICGVTCVSKFEFDEHMINHGQKSRDEQKLEVYPSRYKDPSFNPGTIEVPVGSVTGKSFLEALILALTKPK